MIAGRSQRGKFLRRLVKRSFREREGLFLVEGVRFVEEALASSFAVDMLVYCPGILVSARGEALLEEGMGKGIPCEAAEESLFLELAETVTPQGIMAVMHQKRDLLADLPQTSESWLLLLVDGVRDPGNLGTIIRTGDALGAHGVLVLKGSVDVYNSKTLRASMGSLFHLPVIQNLLPTEVFSFFQDQGIKLAAGVPGKGKPLYHCDLTVPVALLIGGEAFGSETKALQAIHHPISIPMPGKAESLNAAISAAIMLYEALRQRAE